MVREMTKDVRENHRKTSHLPIYTERVDVRDALVGQVVVAVDRETQILGGHHHVVVLDDNVVHELAGIALFHIAQQIVVRHGEVEVKRVGHVGHTRIWLRFRIDLSGEQSFFDREEWGRTQAWSAFD